MAHDVFLSHSTKDKAVTDAVCARLEADGVRCWVAPRDILPGAEWGEAIMQAIGECTVMVLVLSRNSNDSPQVRREVERAIHRGVMVVPFRIEDMQPTGSMEYFLGAPHWLDAIDPPLEEHIAKLAETTKALLGQQSSSEEAETTKPASTSTPTAPAPASSSRRGLLFGVLGLVVLIAALTFVLGKGGDAETPLVVSVPADGAVDVPLDVGWLRLTFDRPMNTDSWTFWQSDQGRFPDLDGEVRDPWRGNQVFEVRLLPLVAHTTYAIQLNSEAKQNFRFADTDEPLPVTTITFRTGR